MAIWPTAVATDADLYVAKNSLQTTLSTAINSSDATIVLASSTGWPTAGAAVIGNEVIFYTGVSGASLTGCTRGADGTTAASHSVGVPVGAAIVAFHHNGLKDEIEAIESSLNLTASRAIVTSASGRLAVATTTAAELGFVNGVTSAIQTQMDLKAPKASPTFTGVAAFPVGSVSAPSINFGTANSGIYGTFSTHISFAVNGVQTLDLQPSSVTVPTGVAINLPDGSVSAPSLTFSTGSQNTGIYVTGAGASMRFASSGSNKLSVVTGGAELSAGNFFPAADATQDLGTSSTRFQNVYAKGLVGTTTNDNAASGNIGEYVSSAVSTFTNYPTSTQWGDVTSISLTAGDWDVSGQIVNVSNGGTVSNFLLGISTTTGNSATGLTTGDTIARQLPPNSTDSSGASIPRVRMSLSGTTTVYLKVQATYNSTAPQYAGSIKARRVR